MQTETSKPSGPLISGREQVQNTWTYVADGDAVPPGGDACVSFERLVAEGDSLRARDGRLGVCIDTSALAQDLAPHLKGVALVAIDIAKFADGRYFSIARELSGRLGYGGELRARGDVLVDQLFYMQRCGFSSWELGEDQDPETSIRLLSTFSVRYQPSSDVDAPLYRNR